ncbi:hypothetical protein BH20ACI1_BH20ACI1_08170 [soil metagenome]
MAMSKIKPKSENEAVIQKAVSCQFTMLPLESELIEDIRHRYQKEAITITNKPVDIVRSEIVRAGILALSKMSPKDLYQQLEEVPILKEGRPKKKVKSKN